MVLPRLGLQAKGAFCPEEVIGRVVLKKRRKLERVAGMTRKEEKKKVSCRKLAVFLRYIFAGLVLKVRVSFFILRIIWRS